MYLSKYLSVFVRKYAELCCELRRHLRLHLCLYLYLDLNPGLFAGLNSALFEKSFQQLFRKSFTSLFGELFDLKYRQFWGQSYLVSYRQTLPRGRSLGRPLHVRIVAGHQRTTTYGWRSAFWTAAARLPLLREGVRRWQALQPVSRGAHRTWVRSRLRVEALAPELRRSLPYSMPRSTADSARGSTPNSTRG